MGSFSQSVTRLLHGAIAVCLSCMATFVFVNVVLRYFFNSGITWSEEASRYLFIWLIFLGAIVAFRENVHLGVDTLIRKFSAGTRRWILMFNNVLLIVTMCLCADGAWKLVLVTTTQVSASLRMPLAFVYVSGFICSVAMALISLVNLYRLAANKVKDEELVMSTDSEDQKIVDAVTGETQEGAK